MPQDYFSINVLNGTAIGSSFLFDRAALFCSQSNIVVDNFEEGFQLCLFTGGPRLPGYHEIKRSEVISIDNLSRLYDEERDGTELVVQR